MMRSAPVNVYGRTFAISARSSSVSESLKLWPADAASSGPDFQPERRREYNRRGRRPRNAAASGAVCMSDTIGLPGQRARWRSPRRGVHRELGAEIDDAFDSRAAVDEEVQRCGSRRHDTVALNQCHLRHVGTGPQVRPEPCLDLHDVTGGEAVGGLQWTHVEVQQRELVPDPDADDRVVCRLAE